ncbi:D-glycerate dehydrogenase [Bacillus tianshenii]|nr:D-glycerate dehydrogenase [Bacillus tianshenii]
MTKPYVFITRRIDKEIVQSLNDIADVHMWESEEEPVPREVLLEEASKADALLTMLSDKVDEELLDKAGKLKVVSNLAVGYDNIDVEAATKRNVIVTNTPDVLNDTTADLTFLLMMAAARRLLEANDYIRKDKWNNWAPMLLAGQDIHHKTVGIVGMGRIGQAVAKRATGFDMKILYHNRSRKEEAERELGAQYCSFEELIEQSDFVVCMTPLTPETKGMLNAEAFKKMKKTAVFVNASRGPVVDEDALYNALKEGDIAGAGLDVFTEEPISSDHPLMSLENAICLPHIGSASIETRKAMMLLAVKNIFRVLNGENAETPVNE